MSPASPICVALDSRDEEEIMRLAAETESSAGMFKVGLTAFVSFGGDMVRSLTKRREVFLDLKLHDIPVQVAGAVSAAGATGASLVTIHASGGRDMIRSAVEASDGVKVLAVTILTSLDTEDLNELGIEGEPGDAVLRLAELAMGAGAHGLVCSPLEVAAVRARFGTLRDGGPYLVVPGIRAVGGDVGDQRRTLSPREAMAAGADLLVIGRPITAAADPAAAAAQILKELE